MKFKGVFLAAILAAVLCLSGNLFAVLSGGGTSANPYLIQSRADFDTFANPANAATYWSSGVYTKLMCNLNLSGTTYSQAPIAPGWWKSFTGFFDGNGHTISNLTINASPLDYIGLFGYVGSGGQINNLGVMNVNVAGGRYVGGLVGENSSGAITSCYAAGSVSGTFDIGGLVGRNTSEGTITSCSSTGSVSGTSNVGGLVGYSLSTTGWGCKYATIISCYSTSSVSGNSCAGGLIGENSSGYIMFCYSTGSVSGNSIVGGLVGNEYGVITSCFWDTQTSGKTVGVGLGSSTGIIGKTTVEMQMLSTLK